MTLLEALIAYGTESEILEGDGIDSFRDFLPEAPDNVVVFAEYAGDPVSPYTENVHRSVQVRVRDRNAELARSRAVKICNLFSSNSEDRRIDFTDELWGQVYIRQTPFKLSQDESDRISYCFNLGITTNILE